LEFENEFSSKLDDFLHLEIERETKDEKIEVEKISISKKLTDLNKTVESLLRERYIRKEDEKFSLAKEGKEYLHKKMKKL